MKKALFFAALAAILYLFFELPNLIKLVIYTAAPFVLLVFAYILERNEK